MVYHATSIPSRPHTHTHARTEGRNERRTLNLLSFFLLPFGFHRLFPACVVPGIDRHHRCGCPPPAARTPSSRSASARAGGARSPSGPTSWSWRATTTPTSPRTSTSRGSEWRRLCPAARDACVASASGPASVRPQEKPGGRGNFETSSERGRVARGFVEQSQGHLTWWGLVMAPS